MQSIQKVRARVVGTALIGMCGTLWGCKDLSTTALPPGTVDPAVYHTATGAMQQVDGTRALFRGALNQFLLQSGLLTDELTFPIQRSGVVDQRQLPEQQSGDDATGAYGPIQNVRVQAELGVQALIAYGPKLPPLFRGELYAIQGYSEIMLADLFCSGIPLTTLALKGNLQYQPPSSRDSVYRHAVWLLDSASVLTADSVTLRTLARVGKGRALLALGQYAAAAEAVAGVQTGDRYALNVVVGNNLLMDGKIDPLLIEFGVAVSDHEGTVGLPYRTSGDPRTVTREVIVQAMQFFVPEKYLVSTGGDSSEVVVASGIEARLIEAEAALQTQNIAGWLTTLNTLRTTGNVTSTTDVYSCPVDRDPNTGDCPVDSLYVRTDTVWEAGTGGVAGLRPLTDPGASLSGAAATNARVDLLFAERAAWLFVTGQRQGDLRRLIRQYHLLEYPTGIYAGAQTSGTGLYGTDVNAPIPPAERANPLFHGCLDRGA